MTYDPSNIFARILRDEAPSVRICETALTLALMDVMPQADGHVLVIPREPATTIFDLSEPAAAACIRTVQIVSSAVRTALRPDGLLIAQLNGEAAGQTVEHVHFHVILRWNNVPLRPHGQIRAAWTDRSAGSAHTGCLLNPSANFVNVALRCISHSPTQSPTTGAKGAEG